MHNCIKILARICSYEANTHCFSLCTTKNNRQQITISLGRILRVPLKYASSTLRPLDVIQ